MSSCFVTLAIQRIHSCKLPYIAGALGRNRTYDLRFKKPQSQLDGYEFLPVGCVDVRGSGGVVDGCGVARGRFVSVVFST